MRLILFEPEIPPNTGNIARLCAATRTPLHLVEPLGFSLDDKHLKRAGLDYWPHVDLSVHPNWPDLERTLSESRLVLAGSGRGRPCHEFGFRPGDCLVLGPETRGLPQWMFDSYPDQVRIPIWGPVRSLNLSTAAGVLLFEALRQTGGLNDR
ncbi:MAG: tRNA (cytidine(34)-2'-O)-methyltransferase [Desulfovibrionaceae bacterium]|nr:tRNA (cytidine(34)-2'-O)-methyltransferase [Desulfovibrionaceae bacterium]MDD4952093.1 tRNA (cytidine(34)-2'-O)-methyltransferase [Desulfovibrionaceae bacterium]